MKPLAERLREKTRQEGDCWIWTGKRDKWGYGHVRVGEKIKLAHRVAYELEYGPFDEALEVLHPMCGRPACINPEHLSLGTDADTVALRGARGHNPSRVNGYKRHPEIVPRGEEHYAAKLTEASVADIRARVKAGGITQRTLAQEYGVSEFTISNIVHGRKWKVRQA